MTAGTRNLIDRLVPFDRTAAAPSPLVTDAELVERTTESMRYQRLTLDAPRIARSALPGQFVMVTVPGPSAMVPPLPRPMAIHRRRPDEGLIELIVSPIGNGTTVLSGATGGSTVTLVGPLGRGFETAPNEGKVLTLSRGIGTCAIMSVIEDAVADERPHLAVLSGATAAQVVGRSDVDELGASSYLVDDVAGTSAVDHLEATLHAMLDDDPPTVIMTCGSRRLMDLSAALGERWGARVEISIEAHMACGLGYCHGCAHSHDGKEGPLVCVDGPVFRFA